MLDVVATMLYDQEVKAAAGEFINTVEKSLAGQEDISEAVDLISR